MSKPGPMPPPIGSMLGDPSRKANLQSLCDLPLPDEFIKPVRSILAPADVSKWLKSKAYDYYNRFLHDVNSALMNNPSPPKETSLGENVTSLMEMLNGLDKIIDDCPPETTAQRYGNKAFRKWHESAMQSMDELLSAVISKCNIPKNASIELMAYLNDSFGNATRIDYGTGHEAFFAMFLCCLYRLKAFTKSDLNKIGLCVFLRYLELVRRLQSEYQMEPAGSQGVWSLDDHHFIPFIWGSAQLVQDNSLLPRHMLDLDAVKRCADENLFFSCIRHINEVKTGPFAEHSNQLWNISGVPSWNKVNQGLFKMYHGEAYAQIRDNSVQGRIQDF